MARLRDTDPELYQERLRLVESAGYFRRHGLPPLRRLVLWRDEEGQVRRTLSMTIPSQPLRRESAQDWALEQGGKGE